MTELILYKEFLNILSVFVFWHKKICKDFQSGSLCKFAKLKDHFVRKEGSNNTKVSHFGLQTITVAPFE